MLIKTSLVHNKQCRPRRLFPNLGHLSSDVGCWTARKQASIERKNPPGWQSSYARLTAKTEHRRDLEANQPNAMHRTTRTTNRARQLGHATTHPVRLTHRFQCITSAGRPLLSQPIKISQLPASIAQDIDSSTGCRSKEGASEAVPSWAVISRVNGVSSAIPFPV